MRYIQNEHGFTLVAALMTMIVLVALSTVVFIVTTKDLRIVTRSIGEKKAFSAAEAGLQYLLLLGSGMQGFTTTNYKYDEATDPDSVFSVTVPPAGSGYDNYCSSSAGDSEDVGTPQGMADSIVPKLIVGENKRYGSKVELIAGTSFLAPCASTVQHAGGSSASP